MSSFRRATALALIATTGLAACGYDDPLEGWGPGNPPAVVVTAAPTEPDDLPDGEQDAGGQEGSAENEATQDGAEQAGADGEQAAPPPPPPPPPPTNPPPPVYAPNGQVQRVRSLDNSFRTETTEVVVGTEIWWTNDGRNEHDVLPVDDAQTWGAVRDVFQPGDEYRHVFLEPGVYEYYCSIHGTKEVGMVGTIVVTAPA